MRALIVSALSAGLLVAGFGATSATAAPTNMVELGEASNYAVLSGLSVANTANAEGAPHTTLRGDLGVKPNTEPTGFPPGVVTGEIRVGSTVDQAHADLVAAYNEVDNRTVGVPLAAELGGLTLSPGLHTSVGAVTNGGTVTLDGGGDPNAVFVFQINGALSPGAASDVVLTNGATPSRVFWQVEGAGTIGANAGFAGTLMALNAVGVGAGTVFNGRALALNGALTLDSNEFYSVPPVVAIVNGDSAYTTDTTPTISGTTDVEAPGDVTVTIDGQILTATPTDGAWSVTSAILANGTYPVLASVQDGAGNPGSDSQQLTVDTALPVVTLDGGTSVTTDDSTATISGTSDGAVDSVVRVAVDSQTLYALVQSGGGWNISPAALADGTYTVTASTSDAAGNVGTDTQSLTVDTVPVVVTVPPETAPLDIEITDAVLRAKKPQKQRRRVKGVVRAFASEPVDLRARGKIKVKGQRRAIRLKPRRKSADADERTRLVLKPRRRVDHRRVLRALRRGRNAVAKISVRFIDAADNKQVLKTRIKLR